MSNPENGKPEGEQPTPQVNPNADQHTEHIPQQGQVPPPDQTQQFPEQTFHTPDPHSAYGQDYQPTQQFPAYDPNFDPYAQPQNPMNAYPVQGGPPDSYSSGGYPPGDYPPGGYPPGYPPQEPPSGPRRWPWIVAAVAVLAVLIIGGGILLGSGGSPDSDTSARAPLTTVSALPSIPSTSPTTTQPTTTTAVTTTPGYGDIDELGTAVGTVESTDGSTLVVETILGAVVTVETNSDTEVIGFRMSKVADIKAGSTVVVQGTAIKDGQMTAETIVAT